MLCHHALITTCVIMYAQGVLTTSLSRPFLLPRRQVLMVWDDGEVRKIIRAAHWVLDRLGLMQAAKSLRSLVICFGVSVKLKPSDQLPRTAPPTFLCRDSRSRCSCC